MVFQLPAVQTLIADKVMETLDKSIDADIHLDKIHFQPFKTLMLKNVVIIDREPMSDVLDSTKAPVDTFFRAGYIIAKFSFEGLLGNGGIHLNSVTISDAQMNLVTEYREDPWNGPVPPNNLSRIFHLKRPQGPRKKSDKEKKIKPAGFEMTPEMMGMMGGFTVLRLATMIGGFMDLKFTKEDLLKLNKGLNHIKVPKQKK